MIGTAFFDDDEDRHKRDTLQELITLRFGPLSAVALAKLASWPREHLTEQLEAALTARSLQELGLDEATHYRKE
jgi:hypothetical protein